MRASLTAFLHRGLALFFLLGGVAYADSLITVASFAGPNGAVPSGDLVQNKQGRIYGTTRAGGASGLGTVYRLEADGTLTTLVSFAGTNGSRPLGGLLLASDGNFYGTTFDGGIYNQGTIFRLGTNQVLTTLCSLDGTNGALPQAGLVEANDGNFYGVTYNGGPYTGSAANGPGTVFQLTRTGDFRTLLAFNGTNNAYPNGDLLQGTDGLLYGVTYGGGDGADGTVFSLTTAGVLVASVPFYVTNGAFPSGGLVEAADGSFFGTAQQGGTINSGGAVFRLSAGGVLSALASFDVGSTNGSRPSTGLIQAGDGSLYGANVPGWIFRCTTNGALTYLFPATNVSSRLFAAQDGNLYGTTLGGGAYGHGTIFRLSLAFPPVIRQVAYTPAGTEISWSAVAGQNYQVQSGTNIPPGAWTPIGPVVTATNGTATASGLPSHDPHRFFRVALVP